MPRGRTETRDKHWGAHPSIQGKSPGEGEVGVRGNGRRYFLRLSEGEGAGAAADLAACLRCIQASWAIISTWLVVQ